MHVVLLKENLNWASRKVFQSITIRIPGISLYLAYSITSSIVLTASKIILPFTNAFWFKLITSGSTFSKRFAKDLEANLASL